jgi:hypothetical protein
MNFLRSPLGFFLIFLPFACRNHPGASEQKTDQAGKNYFPVLDFLKGEIIYVDSTPLAILKYDIGSGKTDSAFIKTEAFNQLAQEFLPPELDSPYFEQHYTESSFIDQSTKSVTFTYASKDSLAGLTRIDVVALPQEGGLNRVKSIYMEKALDKKDTFTLKKLYWKSQTDFFVISIIRPAGQPPFTKQLKVVWGGE